MRDPCSANRCEDGHDNEEQLVEFAKRHFTAANRTVLTLTSKSTPSAGAAK